MGDLSHADLVKIAERWLLRNRGCASVRTELACASTAEIPDAIGFRDGFSILAECKTSRGDFLADARKPFRLSPQTGVGAYRFFLCPEGIITDEDLPPRWGLVWVNSRGKARMVVGPKGNAWSWSGEDFYHERNIHAENGMMASALRRLHLHGVLPLIYEDPRKER